MIPISLRKPLFMTLPWTLYTAWIVGSASLFGSSALAEPAASSSSSKTFAVGAELFGRSPYPLSSRGVRFDYLMREDLSVGFSYIESERSVLLADYRYTEACIVGKSFLSSLLHVSYGLGVRDVVLAYDIFEQEDEAAPDEQIAEKHQAMIANVRFGIDQTIFDTITIGTDLISVSSPLHWTKQDDRFPDGAKDYDEDPKGFPYIDAGFSTNVHVLRTYLLVRF